MKLRWHCPAGKHGVRALVMVASVMSVPALAGSCKLSRLVEFPITMTNLRPLMTAKINDIDVTFLVDSGAFFSVLSPASAAELKLPTYPAGPEFNITGIGGGIASASITKVKTFTLANIPIHNVEFLVGGSDVGTGAVGVLGQNVLHIADVEYDLAQGAVRLLKAYDCGKGVLAYWRSAAQPYSVVDIESTTRLKPFTTGTAFINGHEIRVMFDSGASLSVLSLKAAASVGIKPDSPGVVSAGPASGVGRITIPSYIAPFSSFKIGDEEIRNTRLRIADIDLPYADMLIGSDFFLSHRLLVANSQHKLYFTYNGGAVFNLSGSKNPSVALAPTGSAIADVMPPDSSTASAARPESSMTDSQHAPADGEAAADYSRRGNAFASRRDYQQALTALTRACELAPEHSEYFYQRGRVYWQLRQSAAAMADFDQSLKLNPHDAAVLVARADLALQGGDKVRAGADLDAANAIASKQADIRYEMAPAYEAANLPGPAIAQYDLWMTWHADDARMPEAFSSRCRARAVTGVDLNLALKDCNSALSRAAKPSFLAARSYAARGFVLLRMGNYDKSLLDYDAALKINPKDAWSLYGRGIDELRKQRVSDGQADIVQAEALAPQVAEEFKGHGISP